MEGTLDPQVFFPGMEGCGCGCDCCDGWEPETRVLYSLPGERGGVYIAPQRPVFMLLQELFDAERVTELEAQGFLDPVRTETRVPPVTAWMDAPVVLESVPNACFNLRWTRELYEHGLRVRALEYEREKPRVGNPEGMKTFAVVDGERVVGYVMPCRPGAEVPAPVAVPVSKFGHLPEWQSRG